MSQTTRDWLLSKYIKSIGSISEIRVALQAMTENYRNEAEENEGLHSRVYRLEKELGEYKGCGDVQERLEKMSVSAHVKVYVSMAGPGAANPHVLVIDSLRTSNGETIIHGHI